MKKIEQEKNRPASNIPYQGVNKPFRTQFVMPGPGITVEQDANGVLFIKATGAGVADLEAGDNIVLTKTEDGKVIISSVNSVAEIAAGQNVTIDVDPDTGTAIINSITEDSNGEHYQGVFETAEDLIAFDADPEVGDYGMVKNITYSDGGETTWTGQYKYCFYVGGQWTVVDQMLTFTDNIELIRQFYSVGGNSPVIYLPMVARTGSFNDLRDVPIVATPVLTVEGDTVTATCATEGAEIWYTTDGSMPHVNGTKYTGPITVSEATTFRFVGIKNGMINSLEATVGVDYQLQPPTIDLDWHDDTVTMANPNQSGTIYYTTDGSSPTNASNAYTGPFVITEATNFKAVVIDGSESSDVYSIRYNKLFLDNRSTGGNGIIGTAIYGISSYYKEGAVRQKYGEVHYTIDGSTPTFASEVMVSPISRPYYAGALDVKTKAFGEGFVPSDVDSYTVFSDKPVSPPIIFDPETGNVSLCNSYFESNNLNYGKITGLFGHVKLFIDGTNRYCQVFYTTDGSTPTENSTLFTGPFKIEQNTTVRAIVVAYGQYYSDVAEREITVVDAPTFRLDWEYGEVWMEGPAGADIHYTLDGSEPTTDSPIYRPYPATQPSIVNRESATVKAIAVLDGQSSATTSVTYEGLAWREGGGSTVNYSTGLVSVTPMIPEDGARLYYRVFENGSYSRWLPYKEPVTGDLFNTSGKRIFFKQLKEGYIPQWYEAEFTGKQIVPSAPVIEIDEKTAIVTMSLSGNTAQIPLQTNKNVPSMGARTYYTLDGSTPTPDSSLYTGPFALPDDTNTVKALTECYSNPELRSEVTTEEITPEPSLNYMSLEAVQADSTVSMMSQLATAPDLEYSTDGKTWQEWGHTTPDGVHVFDTITLGEVGDKVYFRGDNPNGLSAMTEGSEIPLFSFFVLSGRLAGGGDVMSLLSKDMGITEVPNYGLALLFSDMGALSDLTMLPYLTDAPAVGATTIGSYGCAFMYAGCTSLTTASDMSHVTTIGESGCAFMYAGCTSLTTASDMSHVTAIGESGCASMYAGCTSLTTASDMSHVTTIGEYGCDSMYAGCTFMMSNDGGQTLSFRFPLPINYGHKELTDPAVVATEMYNQLGFGTHGLLYLPFDKSKVLSVEAYHLVLNGIEGFLPPLRPEGCNACWFVYFPSGSDFLFTVDMQDGATFGAWKRYDGGGSWVDISTSDSFNFSGEADTVVYISPTAAAPNP